MKKHPLRKAKNYLVIKKTLNRIKGERNSKYNNIFIIITFFRGANANFAKISSYNFIDLHVYYAVTEESRKRGLMWKKIN